MERAEHEELWRVTDQAYHLYDNLRDVARGYVKTDERHIRAMVLARRCADRISRREYKLRCAHNSIQPVSTTQVLAWIREHISDYLHFEEIIPAEVAGDVCVAFNVWDEHGSIPAWVWGLCERQAPRAAQKIIKQRSFFVEKPIRYEPDGDVLFA